MRSRITLLHAILSLAMVAIFAFAGAAALAAEPHDYTEQETTGFAFYKLAHKQPRFDDWIDAPGMAADAGPQDRAQKKAWLQAGLDSFVPGQDVITLTSTGLVHIPVISDSEAKNFVHEKPIELQLGESPDMTYFPEQAGRVWIAVVPSEEEAFKTLMLNMPEYKRVQDILGAPSGAQAARAGIKITLKPIRIDTHATIALDHKSMWLMMGEVQSLEIWDPQFRHMAWSYNASGYESGETHDLMNLYSGK